MALRLRKDVQKASYYVWFLGAEEARGLRGPRVLLPAIPHLIERSRDQEPLKVTLQVSQKGMKIVQGTSKHFITHSAITCSVQTDDIVACVLLLYNPTTKCPLHVHAYRCDSETTAQALHQFLQVLINRPDNQKRFAELEARLGLQSLSVSPSRSLNSPDVQSTQPPPPSTSMSSHSGSGSKLAAAALPPLDGMHKTPVRRFESSLGSSDTGTSTRESECSGEDPMMLCNSNSNLAGQQPLVKSSSLYDSLAAELRAKLNGNGPPLLLPPRDYDTVHRSKGNLAATELRRCRNSLIVGDKVSKQQQLLQQQQHQQPKLKSAVTTTRSRGSSGIGSDLAPSPERPIEHSSSDDEEWIPNAHHHLSAAVEPSPFQSPIRKSVAAQQQHHQHVVATTAAYPYKEHFDADHIDAHDHPNQPPPSYLYPSGHRDDRFAGEVGGRGQAPVSNDHSKRRPPLMVNTRIDRSASREKPISVNDEQDIRPIIIRPRTYDSRFKHVLDERNTYPDDVNDDDDDDDDDEVVDHERRHVRDHARDRSVPTSAAAAAGKMPAPVAERQYRTVEDVQLKGFPTSHLQQHQPSPVMSPPSTPSPLQNYRYGEKSAVAVRSAARTPSGGGHVVHDDRSKSDRHQSRDYRENLTDREKYRESQKFVQQKSYFKSDPMEHSHLQHRHHGYDDGDGGGGDVARKLPPLVGRRDKSVGKLLDENDHHQQQQQRHHQSRHAATAGETVKLSRSFNEKIANVEYDADLVGSAERNPYKEPESLPYRESIESMLKSPVMRYKSFEDDAADERQHRQHQAQVPSRRRVQQQQQQQEQQGFYPHQPHPSVRHMRAGSPDTVCRVSPKDRFQNAKEKFAAMERDRNYAAAVPTSEGQQQQQQQLHMHHQRSQSPPLRRGQHHHLQQQPQLQLQQQHQRYSMHDEGAHHAPQQHQHQRSMGGDWSSEDENNSSMHYPQQQPPQQHHQQHQQPLMVQRQRDQQQRDVSSHHQPPTGARRPMAPTSGNGGGYRDGGAGIPASDHPYNQTAGVGPHAGLGPAKSLGNLVRGYRHSYAEPNAVSRHHAPPPVATAMPRNSGRVGLAAVNPF